MEGKVVYVSRELRTWIPLYKKQLIKKLNAYVIDDISKIIVDYII